jgi:hypothetical protein
VTDFGMTIDPSIRRGMMRISIETVAIDLMIRFKKAIYLKTTRKTALLLKYFTLFGSSASLHTW